MITFTTLFEKTIFFTEPAQDGDPAKLLKVYDYSKPLETESDGLLNKSDINKVKNQSLKN